MNAPFSSVLADLPVASTRREGGSILEQVGHTPLLRLEHVTAKLSNVEVYAKAEWFNPGGSVKDRPALNMIVQGERIGALRPGKTILDATSGNTGIAYAMIAAAKGYPSGCVCRQTPLLSGSGS